MNITLAAARRNCSLCVATPTTGTDVPPDCNCCSYHTGPTAPEQVRALLNGSQAQVVDSPAPAWSRYVTVQNALNTPAHHIHYADMDRLLRWWRRDQTNGGKPWPPSPSATV